MNTVVAPDAAGVTIRRETFTRELFEEALPLLTLHKREIAHYQDIELDVDVERYLQAEESGMLRCYVVRLDGKLVGYGAFFVAPHGHYKRSLQALQDVVYVDPACRCSTIGLRLIDYCDEVLRLDGVQVVIQHVKKAAPQLGKILVRKGYEPCEDIYVKRLDRARGEQWV